MFKHFYAHNKALCTECLAFVLDTGGLLYTRVVTGCSLSDLSLCKVHITFLSLWDLVKIKKGRGELKVVVVGGGSKVLRQVLQFRHHSKITFQNSSHYHICPQVPQFDLISEDKILFFPTKQLDSIFFSLCEHLGI